ncbi:hypothetical protein Zmor_004351 [Zophobas morio]|jgi:hypothetical protein|uniref:Uncharacterized protein n=1 Tax=Zophobas morio TaxID=2755281 RepID=A0AA38HHX3_9CUCU|nr:hypothetical protein Zmor_004351 [Zophobas morio]
MVVKVSLIAPPKTLLEKFYCVHCKKDEPLLLLQSEDVDVQLLRETQMKAGALLVFCNYTTYRLERSDGRVAISMQGLSSSAPSDCSFKPKRREGRKDPS